MRKNKRQRIAAAAHPMTRFLGTAIVESSSSVDLLRQVPKIRNLFYLPLRLASLRDIPELGLSRGWQVPEAEELSSWHRDIDDLFSRLFGRPESSAGNW